MASPGTGAHPVAALAVAHTRNHVAMLALAVAQRDRREALGQVVRIVVAAPGSALGRYPEGNTGRARVGLTRPMPVPDDLADLLTRERHRRPVRRTDAGGAARGSVTGPGGVAR